MKKMLKISFLLVLFFVFVFAAQAQTTEKLTLDQAIQIGLSSRKDIANTALQSQIQSFEVEKIKARKLPTVTATGDLRYNYLLQTSVLPGVLFTSPTGQPGEDRNVQFGTNFNILLGVQANQSLFDPTIDLDMQLANLQVAKISQSVQTDQNNAALTIADQYLNAYLTRERAKLIREKSVRWADLREIAQTKIAAGTALPIELDKIDLEIANNAAKIRNEEISLGIAITNLTQKLGLPADQMVTLADSIAIYALLSNAQSVVPTDFAINRPEWQVERLNNEIQALNIKRLDRQYLPTVNLTGTLNGQHLSNNFNVLDNWFPFGYVGVNASYTIFDGYLKKKNKDQLTLQKAVSDNQIESLRNQYDAEYRQRLQELTSATVNLENANQNRLLARRILEKDLYAYRNGGSSLQEVKNSENLVIDAESSCLNAVFQILLIERKRIQAKG
jgi:outer membrane protein